MCLFPKKVYRKGEKMQKRNQIEVCAYIHALVFFFFFSKSMPRGKKIKFDFNCYSHQDFLSIS